MKAGRYCYLLSDTVWILENARTIEPNSGMINMKPKSASISFTCKEQDSLCRTQNLPRRTLQPNHQGKILEIKILKLDWQ